MAFASSSSAPSVVASLGLPVTEKLSRNNNQMWKAQIISALWGVQKAHLFSPDVQPPPKTIFKDNKEVPNP
jgi:hypothetical protein